MFNKTKPWRHLADALQFHLTSFKWHADTFSLRHVNVAAWDRGVRWWVYGAEDRWSPHSTPLALDLSGGLTVGILYGLYVELLVLLKAGDVSLLLQVLTAVEHVFFRRFVGNHPWNVRWTSSRVNVSRSEVSTGDALTDNRHQRRRTAEEAAQWSDVATARLGASWQANSKVHSGFLVLQRVYFRRFLESLRANAALVPRTCCCSCEKSPAVFGCSSEWIRSLLESCADGHGECSSC